MRQTLIIPWEISKSDLNLGIRVNPNISALYNGRGLIKSDEGNIRGAIADFDRAIKLNPKNAAAYRNRANAKQKIKDRAGAISDFNRSAELFNQQGQDAYEMIR